MNTLLQVRDLKVGFSTPAGHIQAVDGVSFDLDHSETLGIIGESGSGKSALALALLGLLGQNSEVRGSVLYNGVNILELRAREKRKLFQHKFSYVAQDPLSALSPFHTVGRQLATIKLPPHAPATAVADQLRQLEINNPEDVLKQYPHQLSGGVRQRIVLAMALLKMPQFLILDEPTSTLDLINQAVLLRLIKQTQQNSALAIIFITHDIAVAGEVSDKIAVFYAGRIVELAETIDLFNNPRMPYTWGLLKSRPQLFHEGPLYSIPGEPPDLTALANGCVFAARCDYSHLVSGAQCFSSRPELSGSGTHSSRCFLSSAARSLVISTAKPWE